MCGRRRKVGFDDTVRLRFSCTESSVANARGQGPVVTHYRTGTNRRKRLHEISRC